MNSGTDSFVGKAVLVTGAASGIGAETARAFADQGATVIAADIAPIEATLAAHTNVRAERLDVTDEADWRKLMTRLRTSGQGLDVLVNSAGVVTSGTIETVELPELKQLFDVNTFGMFAGCRDAIALMKETGRDGAIVNVASANAIKAQSWVSAYAASKAAVVSMTRTTALHCAEAGYAIRVNAILPGIVRTAMVERLVDAAPNPAEALAGLEKFHPNGRLLHPSEISSVVLFLASPAASGVNGAAISVDNGMTAC